MNQVVPEPSMAAETAPGPGAQLLQARLDLGLDVPQVAQRLRLPARLIEAIEHDDYSQLPGATYVRGYLRAYAGLLGIAPGPLLDAHARVNGRQPSANLGKLAVAEQVTSRHQHIRLTTYLVVAVVFGLAIAWWQAREAQRGSAADPAPVNAAASADEPGEPLASEPRAVEPVAATLTMPRERPRESGAPIAPLATGAAMPRSVSGMANVVLHAEQDCWADIRDAAERRLLYENLPAGRTVSLQGVPPFSVYLGNAAGVRLEFNGQVVDVERLRHGPIARFRLGGPAAAATVPVAP